MAVSLHAESGSFDDPHDSPRHRRGALRNWRPAMVGLTLNSTFEYSDRGMKRSSAVRCA